MFRLLILAASASALLGAWTARAEGAAVGDPTRPTALNQAPAPDRTRAEGPRWKLQSTVIAPDRQLAVINGKQLRTGDRVDGATVLEIRSDGVTLQVDLRRMELRLVPQAVSIREGAK